MHERVQQVRRAGLERLFDLLFDFAWWLDDYIATLPDKPKKKGSHA